MPNSIFELPPVTLHQHLPDELRIPPNAQPSQIRVLAYGGAQVRDERVENVEDIEHFLNKAPVVWIDVEGLGTLEVLQWLIDKFDIHPAHLYSSLPLNFYPSYTSANHYQFAIYPQYYLGDIQRVENLVIFRGVNFFLTLHDKPITGVSESREIILKDKYTSQQKGMEYLQYLLTLFTVRTYENLVENYRKELQRFADNPRPTLLPEFWRAYQQVQHFDNKFPWLILPRIPEEKQNKEMQPYWDDIVDRYDIVRQQTIVMLVEWSKLLLQISEQNIRARQLLFLQIIAGLLGMFLPLILLVILIF